MKSRRFFRSPEFPGQSVANGEAEIGVGTLQGLIAIAGIDVVGPLPADLQDTLVFVAAIMASASQAEAGKSLIDFLRGAEAAAVIKAKAWNPPAAEKARRRRFRRLSRGSSDHHRWAIVDPGPLGDVEFSRRSLFRRVTPSPFNGTGQVRTFACS